MHIPIYSTVVNKSIRNIIYNYTYIRSVNIRSNFSVSLASLSISDGCATRTSEQSVKKQVVPHSNSTVYNCNLYKVHIQRKQEITDK